MGVMSRRRNRSPRGKAWNYNKSYRVGKHFRVNVSKRGVGYSYGVKGLKVSHGPRGKHLNVGRGGFRYRERLDDSRPLLTPFQSGIALLIILPFLFATRPALAILLLIIGLPVCFIWGIHKALTSRKEQTDEGSRKPYGNASVESNSHQSWDGWDSEGGWSTNARSSQSRENASSSPRVKFTFQKDPTFEKSSLLLHEFAKTLREAQKFWSVSDVEINTNFKSVAGTTLRRNVAHIEVFDERNKKFKDFQIDAPMYILTRPGSLQGDVVLAPGLVILDSWLGQKEPTVYRLADLLPQSRTTRFLETETIPSDARAVGQTWLYVNKDGGPDRRYRDNRIVSIMEYGEVTLGLVDESKTVVLHLQISSLEVSDRLYKLIQNVSDNPPRNEQGQRSADDRGAKTVQPPPSTETSPYSVLGVNPSATSEEIQQAYRTLVKKYHPDRVGHLGAEFHDLAEIKMKEINAAYATALRRANG